MWCCVGGRVLLDVLEYCIVCIFRIRRSMMGGLLVPEDEGNAVLPNVKTYSPSDTASCP